MGSRADFGGNYPPGAANDPCAPYNEVDPLKKLYGLMTMILMVIMVLEN